MSIDPAPPSGPPRRPLILPLLALALLMGVGAFLLVGRRPSATGPTAPPLAQAQPPPAAVAPAPNRIVVAPPAAKAKTPPLIPGNPFTDERFAAISCQIVIAAIGLKHSPDWEANVVAYMDQELEKAGFTPAQYNAYALALHQHPDRAKAVADDIMRRVEKKIGYHVSMDTLPVFKFDPEALKKVQQKLEH